MATDGEKDNSAKIILINGDPSYASNVALGCAYANTNKKILLVDSVSGSQLYDLNKELVKKREEKGNGWEAKTFYDYFLGDFNSVEEVITPSSLENLDFILGSDNYGLKIKINEDAGALEKYVKNLEELKRSGDYSRIIINGGEFPPSLFNSDRQYIFLNGGNIKAGRQLDKFNSILFAESRRKILSQFFEKDILHTGHKLEELFEKYGSQLRDEANERKDRRLEDIAASFKYSSTIFMEILNDVRTYFQRAGTPSDKAYMKMKYLFSEKDDSIRGLSLGINDEDGIKDAKIKEKILEIIGNVVAKPRVGLFYLPDTKLIKKSADSGAPLLWHIHNLSPLHDEAKKSPAAKSLEDISRYILTENPEIAPRELIKNGQKLFFEREFTQEKKDYAINLKKTIDNSGGYSINNGNHSKPKPEAEKVIEQKAISRDTKDYSFGRSIINGLKWGAGAAAGILMSGFLLNFQFPFTDSSISRSEIKAYSEREKQVGNYSKIVKKREDAKKDEARKTMKIRMEEQRKERIAREKAIALSMEVEAEKKKKEAIERQRQMARQKTEYSVMNDREFLSNVENLIEFTNGKKTFEFFNTNDVVGKKCGLEINVEGKYIKKTAAGKTYMCRLRDSEIPKIRGFKEKSINKYISNVTTK